MDTQQGPALAAGSRISDMAHATDGLHRWARPLTLCGLILLGPSLPACSDRHADKTPASAQTPGWSHVFQAASAPPSEPSHWLWPLGDGLPPEGPNAASAAASRAASPSAPGGGSASPAQAGRGRRTATSNTSPAAEPDTSAAQANDKPGDLAASSPPPSRTGGPGAPARSGPMASAPSPLPPVGARPASPSLALPPPPPASGGAAPASRPRVGPRPIEALKSGVLEATQASAPRSGASGP
jgi:hypothetical protein